MGFAVFAVLLLLLFPYLALSISSPTELGTFSLHLKSPPTLPILYRAPMALVCVTNTIYGFDLTGFEENSPSPQPTLSIAWTLVFQSPLTSLYAVNYAVPPPNSSDSSSFFGVIAGSTIGVWRSSTGLPLWNYTNASNIYDITLPWSVGLRDPVVVNEILYIGAQNLRCYDLPSRMSYVWAMSMKNGSIFWVSSVPNCNTNIPMVINTTAGHLAATGVSNLGTIAFILKLSDGKMNPFQYTYDESNGFVGITFLGDLLFIVQWNGYLTVFNTQTGDQSPHPPDAGCYERAIYNPIIVNGLVYVMCDTFFQAYTADSHLRSVGNSQSAGSSYNVRLFQNDVLWLGTTAGTIHKFDFSTSSPKLVQLYSGPFPCVGITPIGTSDALFAFQKSGSAQDSLGSVIRYSFTINGALWSFSSNINPVGAVAVDRVPGIVALASKYGDNLNTFVLLTVTSFDLPLPTAAPTPPPGAPTPSPTPLPSGTPFDLSSFYPFVGSLSQAAGTIAPTPTTPSPFLSVEVDHRYMFPSADLGPVSVTPPLSVAVFIQQDGASLRLYGLRGIPSQIQCTETITLACQTSPAGNFCGLQESNTINVATGAPLSTTCLAALFSGFGGQPQIVFSVSSTTNIPTITFQIGSILLPMTPKAQLTTAQILQTPSTFQLPFPEQYCRPFDSVADDGCTSKFYEMTMSTGRNVSLVAFNSNGQQQTATPVYLPYAMTYTPFCFAASAFSTSCAVAIPPNTTVGYPTSLAFTFPALNGTASFAPVVAAHAEYDFVEQVFTMTTTSGQVLVFSSPICAKIPNSCPVWQSIEGQSNTSVTKVGDFSGVDQNVIIHACDGSEVAWQSTFKGIGECAQLEELVSLKTGADTDTNALRLLLAQCSTMCFALASCETRATYLLQAAVCLIRQKIHPNVLIKFEHRTQWVSDCGLTNSYFNQTVQFLDSSMEMYFVCHNNGGSSLVGCGALGKDLWLTDFNNTCPNGMGAKVHCTVCQPYLENDLYAVPYGFLAISALRNLLVVVMFTLVIEPFFGDYKRRLKARFFLLILPVDPADKDPILAKVEKHLQPPETVSGEDLDHDFYSIFGITRDQCMMQDPRSSGTQLQSVMPGMGSVQEQLIEPSSSGASLLPSTSSSSFDLDYLYQFYVKEITLDRSQRLKNVHEPSLQLKLRTLAARYIKMKQSPPVAESEENAIDEEYHRSQHMVNPTAVPNEKSQKNLLFPTAARRMSLMHGAATTTSAARFGQGAATLEMSENRTVQQNFSHVLPAGSTSAAAILPMTPSPINPEYAPNSIVKGVPLEFQPLELAKLPARWTTTMEDQFWCDFYSVLRSEEVTITKVRSLETSVWQTAMNVTDEQLVIEVIQGIIYFFVCTYYGLKTSGMKGFQITYFQFINSSVSTDLLINAFSAYVAFGHTLPLVCGAICIILLLPAILTNMVPSVIIFLPVSAVLAFFIAAPLVIHRKYFPKTITLHNQKLYIMGVLLLRCFFTFIVTLSIQALFNWGLLFLHASGEGNSWGETVRHEYQARSFLCSIQLLSNLLTERANALQHLFSLMSA